MSSVFLERPPRARGRPPAVLKGNSCNIPHTHKVLQTGASIRVVRHERRVGTKSFYRRCSQNEIFGACLLNCGAVLRSSPYCWLAIHKAYPM